MKGKVPYLGRVALDQVFEGISRVAQGHGPVAEVSPGETQELPDPGAPVGRDLEEAIEAAPETQGVGFKGRGIKRYRAIEGRTGVPAVGVDQDYDGRVVEEPVFTLFPVLLKNRIHLTNRLNRLRNRMNQRHSEA